MPYKPTETRWLMVRLAIFTFWPGLPVYGLLEWLTALSTLACVLLAAGVVIGVDGLVELIRCRNDDDGEFRP